MTLLSRLVETSEAVAGTSSRRAKIAAIAGLLRGLDRDEIGIAVAYLAGYTRQGRSGIGYALISSARHAPAAMSTLHVRAVDQAGCGCNHDRKLG